MKTVVCRRDISWPVLVVLPGLWILDRWLDTHLGQPDLSGPANTFISACLCGLVMLSFVLSEYLLRYTLSADGLACSFGPWLRWRVSWQDYAGWRWNDRILASGKKAHPWFPPLCLYIRASDGQRHVVWLGGRSAGPRVIPSRDTRRFLEALQEYAPRLGEGWAETVGFPSRPEHTL